MARSRRSSDGGCDRKGGSNSANGAERIALGAQEESRRGPCVRLESTRGRTRHEARGALIVLWSSRGPPHASSPVARHQALPLCNYVCVRALIEEAIMHRLERSLKGAPLISRAISHSLSNYLKSSAPDLRVMCRAAAGLRFMPDGSLARRLHA